jgi:Domain of unknown function (DUF4349)
MPDLPDLEALVRATRPLPDPAWAARLDSRVARGFPDAAPVWYLWPFALIRSNLVPAGALASVVVLLAAVVLTGVNGRGSDDNANSSSSGSSTAGAEKSSGGGSSAGSQAAPPAAVPRTAAPDIAGGDRATRRSAEIVLSTRAREVERVSDGAIRVADQLGGFVQSSSVNSGGSEAGAELVLQIPSERLPQALSQLSRLGHVRSRSQQAEDLTDQRSSLRAAVTDARAERDGLRRRLARAETDTERARLRGQLQRAEQLIVTRKRRLDGLNREVSYATVGVEVQGDRSGATAPPPGGRWTPGDALHDAGRVLEVSAGVAVIGLAVIVPLGLLAALAAVAGRMVVRRRRERALELA